MSRAVHNHVVGAGQVPLHLQQKGPHLGIGRHLGGIPGDGILPNGPSDILPPGGSYAAGRPPHRPWRSEPPAAGRPHPLSGRSLPPAGRCRGPGYVDGPCIHIKKAQTVRQSPGQGALPCSSRAVNGYTFILHTFRCSNFHLFRDLCLFLPECRCTLPCRPSRAQAICQVKAAGITCF